AIPQLPPPIAPTFQLPAGSPIPTPSSITPILSHEVTPAWSARAPMPQHAPPRATVPQFDPIALQSLLKSADSNGLSALLSNPTALQSILGGGGDQTAAQNVLANPNLSNALASSSSGAHGGLRRSLQAVGGSRAGITPAGGENLGSPYGRQYQAGPPPAQTPPAPFGHFPPPPASYQRPPPGPYSNPPPASYQRSPPASIQQEHQQRPESFRPRSPPNFRQQSPPRGYPGPEPRFEERGYDRGGPSRGGPPPPRRDSGSAAPTGQRSPPPRRDEASPPARKAGYIHPSRLALLPDPVGADGKRGEPDYNLGRVEPPAYVGRRESDSRGRSGDSEPYGSSGGARRGEQDWGGRGGGNSRGGRG
ncbi:hypothetical protein P7C70_g9618, partial [Phenoliferia sp. Uapishka_3]